jgi:hypothetical protein
MIDVSERGRGEVRVFVERRPAPQLAVQAVTLARSCSRKGASTVCE